MKPTTALKAATSPAASGHGPNDTCWHVWLEAPPAHQFRKATGRTVTFVQLHGTGRQQIVRRIPRMADQYMTDQGLLNLYQSPEPQQVMGSRVDEIMKRLASRGLPGV